MYSPKINENLIPALYRAAKAQGVPMTVLVNRLLTESMARENLTETTHVTFVSCAVPAPAGRQLAA